MWRPPNTGPAERERQQQIRRCKALLRELVGVPPYRREDEVADVREGVCRRMLAELGAPRYALSQAPEAAVEIVDIEDVIDGRG